MLRPRNLDRSSRDSLSSEHLSEYVSDQSPDDLSLLRRFNSLLASVNLPKLSNGLDATPSLLIALYESIPPFQRVPFVDTSETDFGARLRHMKLLVGCIASGRYGLLTKETRDKLEGLDLRRFCEKDMDTVRDVIEIIVQVGERGRAAVAGSETPKKPGKSEPAKTPRLKARTGRISGNDLERTPTPRKRRPVLVLPVAAKSDGSGSSVGGKDSGWDGSTLGVLSQAGKEYSKQDGLVSGSNISVSDPLDARPKKTARTVNPSRTPSSSSACSSISPGFLENFSARVNAIVDRSPAPPPYSEEDRRGGKDDEDNFDTPKQRRMVGRTDKTPKATPMKRLFVERIQQRDAKTDHFGDELLSSHEWERGGPSRDSTLRSISGTTNGEGSRNRIVKEGGDKDDARSQCTWITEDASVAGSQCTFPSLAKKNVLRTGAKKSFTPIRAIRWDADGAAYVPLPPSRPTSPSSATPYSKRGNDLPSKSPLPFPPSLLRTMHWATSLPTPPLSPKSQRTQKSHSPNTPSRVPKQRRVVTATPSSPVMTKRRDSTKRSSIAGSPTTLRRVSGKSDLVVEVPETDDRDDWESIKSSRKSSKQSQFSQPRQEYSDQMPLSFATTLVSDELEELGIDKYARDTYGNDRDSGSETDRDSDDRTTLYSVSTVSWGEDDPFTAALRLKRQIASEKLKEVERSFSDEIERKRMGGPEVTVADRLRWRASEGGDTEEESTDSDGGLTDVEEELRALEEIGRKESIRQGFLLQRLMQRGP